MNRPNLRKRKRINYYEPDEPAFDEYIYCESCYDYVYEYCAIHGPLLIIADNEVPSKAGIPPWVPRAALTTPRPFLHIAPSTIPGAGLGVFSSLTLPRGVRFGPYCGKRMDKINSMYCWQIHGNIKNPVVDGLDGESSNWMRYVNCARNWHEQNLVAFQYQGQIYYRTVKIIPKFTELMVFYGSEFAYALGIDLKNYNNNQIVKVDKYIIEEYNNNEIEINVNTSKSVYNTEMLEICEEIPKKSVNNKEDKVHEEMENNNEQVHTELVTVDTARSSNSTYINEINRKDNITTKTVIKTHKCDVCNKLFAKKINLKRHVITHQEKTHKCSECSYKTNNRRQLTYHIANHTKDKVYMCAHCTYVAYVRKYIQEHIKKVHNKVEKANANDKCYKLADVNKPRYNCPRCNYETNKRYRFNTHMEIHTKDKVYQCDLCPYVSNVRVYVTRHKRKLHSKILNSNNGTV